MKVKVKALAALLLLTLLVIVAAACQDKKADTTMYHCPMHPTVVSDKPGDCPICGMRLVPLAKPTPGPTAAPTTEGQRKILYYRNPMDPTVTSPVPMKDSMGMDYVPVYAGEEGQASSVAGYAPVMLEPQGIARSGIQTAMAESGKLGEAIRAVAIVLPDERLVTHVHTKISGWVEELFVNFTGQWVQKGEPLLSVYSPELLASQEEYLRAKDLVTRLGQSNSPQAQKAAFDLEQAARERLLLFDVPESFFQQLQAGRKPMRTVTLLAPRKGYVLAKNTFPGQRVEPGMELYTLADLSRVWIEADFYEQEAAFLAVGLQARVTLPYQPDLSLKAPITYVYPTLDSKSRTVRARLELPNPGLRLKPGMYTHVEVAAAPSEGVLIPDSAVIETGTRSIVFVETQPGFFVPKEVTVRQRSLGKALVSQGLTAGERVVVKGTFLLDSESRLQAALAGPRGADHD